MHESSAGLDLFCHAVFPPRPFRTSLPPAQSRRVALTRRARPPVDRDGMRAFGAASASSSTPRGARPRARCAVSARGRWRSAWTPARRHPADEPHPPRGVGVRRGARLRASGAAGSDEAGAARDAPPSDPDPPRASSATLAPGARSERSATSPPRASSSDASNDASPDDDASSADLDRAASLFARADGAVSAAIASFLGGDETDLDARVPARRPPTLGAHVDIAGPVPELAWHASVATRENRADVVDALRSGIHLREPVIFRGAADEWPAVCDESREWTLARLVRDHGDFEGDARVRRPEGARRSGARRDQFQYVEANHPAVRSGAFDAPSKTERLTLREAARRMLENKDGERGVYVQAELSDALAEEAGLAFDESHSTSSKSGSGTGDGSRVPRGRLVPLEPWASFEEAGWTETQPARLWLSAAGSVSPLHFDHSASVLAQVRGQKRMLLYPPSALRRARLYPDWHPLRRRSRINLSDEGSSSGQSESPGWADGLFSGPDHEWHGADERDRGPGPRRGGPAGLGGRIREKDSGSDDGRSRVGWRAPPGAWEAVLGPGDVLVFPPRWAHYTESLGDAISASVTRRFATTAPNRATRNDAFERTFLSPKKKKHAGTDQPGCAGTDRGKPNASNTRDDRDHRDDRRDRVASGAARYARWASRLGPAPTPSDGRASVAQLEAAGAVRALAAPRRLDASGAVVRADAASGADARLRRETDANGRGGVEGWKAQWWDAATDAAAMAREVIDDETAEERTNEGSTRPGEERTENEGSTTPGEERTNEGSTRPGSDSSSSSNVVGAYARGSVALGTAVASVSDVDVLVLRWAPAPPASSSRSSSRAPARLLAETDARIRARLRGEWSARWGHLATKPDVRVIAVPRPPHPAGEALRKIVDAEKKQSSERDVDAGSRREEKGTETSPGETSRDVSREEDVVRTSRFAALANVLGPGATFALAAEGATIFGPDLPRLAPSAWRKPPADGRCLDGLHADVVEALSDGGERALGWALKRCVRAAFERAFADAAADDDGGGGGLGVYTRDLFHCAAIAADARPELGEDLAAALAAAAHGPRAVWGALWYASGSACAVRIRDALLLERES